MDRVRKEAGKKGRKKKGEEGRKSRTEQERGPDGEIKEC